MAASFSLPPPLVGRCRATHSEGHVDVPTVGASTLDVNRIGACRAPLQDGEPDGEVLGLSALKSCFSGFRVPFDGGCGPRI